MQDSLVVLNSAHRTSGTPGAFTCALSRKIRRPQEIRVAWVSIPYSFYPIHTQNNTLRVITGTGASVVQVPVGNYSQYAFVQTLQEQLAVVHASFVVTLNEMTARVTIAAGIDFTVEAGVTSPLAALLGVPVTTASVNRTVVSPGVLNIAGPQYLYIVSSRLSELRNRPTISSGSVNDEAIAVIPVNTNFGNYIYAELDGFVLDVVKATTLDTTTAIDLSLYDDQGALVDLNGVNWTIALVFKRDFS